ncbi:MAG: hypothetical protein ACXWRE_09185 [Pseudobdellovibrionaceae bacterium]
MKYLGLLLLLTSCASSTVNKNGVNIMSEAHYEAIVDKWSDHVEDYNGLNNTVTIMATLLNPEMATAQLDQSARLYQWDQNTFNSEKQKLENNLNKQTEIFVSFYSPERKWDDLYKSKTLWKIFLDVNGQRFEGKATKIKLLPREVQSLYHYHTSFASPYIVSFPVSARTVDNKPARLTFTGAIGSITLNFGEK